MTTIKIQNEYKQNKTDSVLEQHYWGVLLFANFETKISQGPGCGVRIRLIHDFLKFWFMAVFANYVLVLGQFGHI